MAPAAPVANFGRAGRPTLPWEKVDVRDVLEANEVLWLMAPASLLVLPCVAVLL
jgi:hypothetical protein